MTDFATFYAAWLREHPQPKLALTDADYFQEPVDDALGNPRREPIVWDLCK